jgi:hypothetical protein
MLGPKWCGVELLAACGSLQVQTTSQNRLAPSTWTVITVREEDLVACSVLKLLATIPVKEIPAASCTSATP